MNQSDSWPDDLAVGATRIARRSNHYDEAVEFYRDLVGLPLLHVSETGVDDIGCTIFGLPGTAATFELIPARDRVPVDRHEQFVLYFPGSAARDMVAGRLRRAGHGPADQSRYWALNDAVTFLDPDGRELVLAPWVFGATQPPMHRHARTANA